MLFFKQATLFWFLLKILFSKWPAVLTCISKSGWVTNEFCFRIRDGGSRKSVFLILQGFSVRGSVCQIAQQAGRPAAHGAQEEVGGYCHFKVCALLNRCAWLCNSYIMTRGRPRPTACQPLTVQRSVFNFYISLWKHESLLVDDALQASISTPFGVCSCCYCQYVILDLHLFVQQAGTVLVFLEIQHMIVCHNFRYPLSVQWLIVWMCSGSAAIELFITV